MFFIDKKPDTDFRILNIADPQISAGEFQEKSEAYRVMVGTWEELMRRVKPDYITCTGDLTYGEEEPMYHEYVRLFEQYGLPWSFVFGNHDNQAGTEAIHRAASIMKEGAHCLFEEGNPELGNGNYTVCIRENGKIVLGIIFMDTHDRFTVNGEENWGRLESNQLEWYREQVAELKKIGCNESMIVTHIPIYAYRLAADAAYKGERSELSVADCDNPEVWNEGYKDSFGVCHEGISSCNDDEGALDVIEELGHTKLYMVGHDHTDDFCINYHGVKLLFALKTGPGCYWEPELNGGTVITVGSDGIKDIKHVYVDPKPFQNKANKN